MSTDASLVPPLPRLSSPTPQEIRRARAAAGLTQTQAARVIGVGGVQGYRTWQRYEALEDPRPLRPGAWALFLLMTGQHPTHTLAVRPEIALEPGTSELAQAELDMLLEWFEAPGNSSDTPTGPK